MFVRLFVFLFVCLVRVDVCCLLVSMFVVDGVVFDVVVACCCNYFAILDVIVFVYSTVLCLLCVAVAVGVVVVGVVVCCYCL